MKHRSGEWVLGSELAKLRQFRLNFMEISSIPQHADSLKWDNKIFKDEHSFCWTFVPFEFECMF